MKQVIFIGLLSISLCLSTPQNASPNPDPANHDVALQENAKPPASIPAQDKDTSNTQAPQGNAPSVTPDAKPTTHNEFNTSPKVQTTTTTTPAPTSNRTVTEKIPQSITKAPAEKTTTATQATVSTTASSPTKAAPVEPDHKATIPPKTPEPVPVHARGFDGASFVGGIILTLGLLAIGFMGFKYYKNQTERNYHTL